MKIYRNLGGNSSVQAYQDGKGRRVRAYRAGKDSIRVKFTNGDIYLYTYGSAGEYNVEMMKLLARAGIGLNSFIKRRAEKLYASKG